MANQPCSGRKGDRHPQIVHAIGVSGPQIPARMLTWMDGINNVGAASVASRAIRIFTNSSSLTPSCTWTL